MNQSGKSIKEIAKQHNIRPESIYPFIKGLGVIKWDKLTRKRIRIKNEFQKPVFEEKIDYFFVIGTGYRITPIGEEKINAWRKSLEKK